MVGLNDNFEIYLGKAGSDFQTKWFRQSTTTRAQLSVAVATVRLNGSSYLLCQDLSQSD